MANGKPRVCVLGGGVRGCSIAALLAESGYFAVTLFERSLIGSGITSVNQGRLHSGASLCGYRAAETVEEKQSRAVAIRRRLKGAELIRKAMADWFREAQPAVYLIHHELAAAFIEACAEYGVPHSQHLVDAQVRSWINSSLTEWTAINVPEYAFVPTQLTLRLAMAASAAGALILPNHPVQSVARHGETFRIRLADQSLHEADAVVNSAGGWASTIRCELHHHLDLSLLFGYPEIRLLIVRDTRHAPSLNRAIAIIEPDSLVPTVVPHSKTFVLHANVRVTPGSTASVVERALIDVCNRFFPPLAALTNANAIGSVCGCYPLLEHLPPSRPFRVHSTVDKSFYWVVSGGNATTTLVDASDTVETMLRSMRGWRCPRESVAEWLARLVVALRVPRACASLEALAAKMVWE